jgi:hypothetical protein
MRGLELAEQYYREYGAPLIEQKFGQYQNRIAAGLVGDGSECYGFDDEISRDHDWGPGFCLWLDQNDYRTIGPALTTAISQLPSEFAGFSRQVSDWGQGRVGVFEIGQFYRRFIGFDHLPSNNREWRAIPEENLAAATNGKIFIDPMGEFTRFRTGLEQFYPEDVRLKKIAARCMTIGRAGQYNYQRCAMRKEEVAARYAEVEFCTQTISLVFLLNRQYKPFFKWMHRAVKTLPILGETIYNSIEEIVTSLGHVKKIRWMEETCAILVNELGRQGLCEAQSGFLVDQGQEVQAKIKDPELRASNVWIE